MPKYWLGATNPWLKVPTDQSVMDSKLVLVLTLLLLLVPPRTLAQKKLPARDIKAVTKLAQNPAALVEARIAALWTLADRGELHTGLITGALADPSAAVRKAALQIISEKGLAVPATALLSRLSDPDARVRLEAIIALGSLPALSREAQLALIAAYPAFKDPWTESAVAGVAGKAPVEFISAALAANDPDSLKSLVVNLSAQIAARQDAAGSARLVVAMAATPSTGDALKQAVLENLAKGLKVETAPLWSAELQGAFKKMLASPGPVAPAAFPLIARWDKSGAMAGDVKALVGQLTATLKDAARPDEQRAQAATSLLGARQLNEDILPRVAGILGSSASVALQRRVIEALGAIAEPAVGAQLAAAYPALGAELQEYAFGQIIRRRDWSLALLEAIRGGKINLAALGPLAISRLRTHSDQAVSQRANQIIDELRGPEVKEKNELIARLTPVVTQPGNAENGKQLFAQNCAVCHLFNGQGKDIAPDLTGMGVHGAAELLVHVVDPNRVVEPNFFATSIETTDGQTLDGIITRENKSGVLLRNASGDIEVKTENIKSRRNTGRSLMPEGFEALGAEPLRDLLAYLCAGESRYRALDLSGAFTANSTRGIYASLESTAESLQFRKFGLLRAGEVPFEVVAPTKTANGNNLIVLKGGEGLASTMPRKVEATNVGVPAIKLHFLGGVGGWAYPCCGGNQHENLPVAKITVHFADGQSEEIVLRNAVEIADYNGTQDVPGSRALPEALTHGQVRWFTKPLSHPGVIQKITLESFDTAIAPTFVAITAETGEAEAAPKTAAGSAQLPQGAAAPAEANAGSAFSAAKGAKTLIFGGGSSHDFNQWFGTADVRTLGEITKGPVLYSEDLATLRSALQELAVLYLSSNQPLADDEVKRGILAFADAGKGLVLAHPALWYNWNDWPEYNRVLVGGGARSHDKYGEFEVKLTGVRHAVTEGVPALFRISDELYHFEPDPNGTPILVLATAYEEKTGKTFPSVWIVQHPRARIVCIALGHDGKAHEHPAYQALLRNAVRWAAGK